MKEKLGIRLFALLVLLIGWQVVTQYQTAQATLTTAKHDYAYQVCEYSHDNISFANDEACRNAQSETNTEFLCNRYGTSCWIEDK